MKKIDNIKNLFNDAAIQQDRNEFYEVVAKEFGLEVSSVRVGWFHRFEIPKKYKIQENLIVIMQNFIANKNAVMIK
ncbi:hypothetical protein [Lutibacter maritimus]|uniref:Uncharacterized protein n=1 Tax=Lutibacter maritimus TaxID=593133 RepID=A0A1I6NR15_9FLAO|nr:hypothetical protein [Lutibacter maritimus]SFS30426.1 hypothetical protein SAMN04488006_0435 [Lutibacter maritimus]